MDSFKTYLEEQKPLPDWLYHVTPFAEEIMRSGFQTRDKHGKGSILGGAGEDAVSFTTLENAKSYQKGLRRVWQAVHGQLDIENPDDMLALAREFGFPIQEFKKHLDYVNGYIPYASKEKRIHNLFQQLAIPGFMKKKGVPRIPLIMGGSLPSRLKDSNGISVLAIRKGNAQKSSYHPGESEWRVYDPENLDYSSLHEIE